MKQWLCSRNVSAAATVFAALSLCYKPHSSAAEIRSLQAAASLSPPAISAGAEELPWDTNSIAVAQQTSDRAAGNGLQIIPEAPCKGGAGETLLPPKQAIQDLISVLRVTENDFDWDAISNAKMDKPLSLGNCSSYAGDKGTCEVTDGLVATSLLAMDLETPEIRAFAEQLAAGFVRVQERRNRLRGSRLNWSALFDVAMAAYGMVRSGPNATDAINLIIAAAQAVDFAQSAEGESQNIRTDYALIQASIASFASAFLLENALHEGSPGSAALERNRGFDQIVFQTKFRRGLTTTLLCPLQQTAVIVIPKQSCVALFDPQKFLPFLSEDRSGLAPYTYPANLTAECPRWVGRAPKNRPINWSPEWETETPEWKGESVDVTFYFDGIVGFRRVPIEGIYHPQGYVEPSPLGQSK